MPNKTIYITEADIPTWDQAAEIVALTGTSMSQLIAELLSSHLAEAEAEAGPVRFTAEVFMARIGPRALTRNLVEQLDYVRDLDCVPFGRIKPRPGDIDIDVHVLGRHVTDGSLVKAKRSRPDPGQLDERTFIAAMRKRVGDLIKSGKPITKLEFVNLAADHGYSRQFLNKTLQFWANNEYLVECFDSKEWKPGPEYQEDYFNGAGDQLPTADQIEAAKLAFDEYLALPLILLAD